MAKGNDLAVGPAPSKGQAAEERRWKAEDALRTLNRAEEIRCDPKLMGDVQRLAQDQIKNLQKHATPPAAPKVKPVKK